MQDEFENLRIQLLDLLWKSGEDAKMIVKKMKGIDRKWKRFNKIINKKSSFVMQSTRVLAIVNKHLLINWLKLEIKRVKEVQYE